MTVPHVLELSDKILQPLKPFTGGLFLKHYCKDRKNPLPSKCFLARVRQPPGENRGAPNAGGLFYVIFPNSFVVLYSMKRIWTAIMVTGFLAGTLFCQELHAHMPWKNRVYFTPYDLHSHSAPLAFPTLTLPFFQFLHVHEDVCAKPLFPWAGNYHLAGIRAEARPIGAYHLQVNSRLSFRKGNSYFVVPQTFTLPLMPDMELSRPSLIFSNSQ